jgi:hypothetical protein
MKQNRCIFSYIIIIVLIIVLIYIIYKSSINIVESYKDEDESLYTAIIIEPREHKALEFVLTNFVKNLDENWNFIVFHGNKNESFVREIIYEKLKNEKNRIKMINLKVDNLSLGEYNKLLYTKSFYENIPSEIFLIFQTDSAICSEFKEKLNEFLEYDYVGAPWKGSNKLGNGGLSLRKKTKMLEILEKCPLDMTLPEDLYYSSGCDDIKISKPSVKKAKEFSVETMAYNKGSFGIHKSWAFLESKDYEKLVNICPELKSVEELQ